MMEVESPYVQNGDRGRRTEKIPSLERRSPSVDTALSLRAPSCDNKGASTNMGRSSPVLTAANWTPSFMPQCPLAEPTQLNEASIKVHDSSGLGDGDVVNPLGVLDTQGTRIEMDDQRLNIATQPVHAEESQSSQTDFNNRYSCGDQTQLLQDTQVGLDDTQPPLCGETQPVSSQEGFDDMVVLQNNTLTASPILPTSSRQNFPVEQNADNYWLIQDSLNVPAYAQMVTSVNGIPASYESNASTRGGETFVIDEGLPETMSDIGVHEDPQVHPVSSEKVGPTKGKEERNTPSSVPQQDLLTDAIYNNGKPFEGKEERNIATPVSEQGLLNKDGDKNDAPHEGRVERKISTSASPQDHLSEDVGRNGKHVEEGKAGVDVKDDRTRNAKVLSAQDIQETIGRKVVKKFGRKNYVGEVVNFDAENQWFKVVYEDGDEEDLELAELEGILIVGDIATNASTAKRKQSNPEGGVRRQRARTKKRTLKKKGKVLTKSRRVNSRPGSKTKGIKRSPKPKSSQKSPTQTGSSGVKRKRRPDVEAVSNKPVPEEEETKGNKQLGNAKALRKSSGNQGKARSKRNSAKKEGTRHQSPPALQIGELKVVEGSAGIKTRGMSKGKRQKLDALESQDTLVGKAVKKDFDGTLYSGVVARFDEKSEYYKVEYEDGDQEEMELEELNVVLVA